ncbi:MAG: hypothetical protein JWN48_3001 [Myxococcaceae bacterium]|nr:hypothetical protein [Myxococcaceae bacterium]
MRRVSEAERAFLLHYFHNSLAIERISLGTSLGRRSWSPLGARISLTRDLFQERDPLADVRLEDPGAASVFAHEALHVWQRQHGRAVTRQGARLQAGYALGLFDPYAYDTSVREPDALLALFLFGNIEQQGRMMQDYVAADLRGEDTTRFGKLAQWVRNSARRRG